MGGIGEVFGAFSNMVAAKDERDAIRAQLKITKRDARINAASLRRDAARRLGRMHVIVAAQGLELEGSPLDVISQNAAEFEMEAAAVERGAADASRIADMRISQNSKAELVGLVGSGIKAFSSAGKQGMAIGG